MCRSDEQSVIPLAHSANIKRHIPAQTYVDHIVGVTSGAVDLASSVSRYARHNRDLFVEAVRVAAEYHDLGKLDTGNQTVLEGKDNARKLPVQHTEAGTVYLLDRLGIPTGAALVHSHHIGLPDFVAEQNRSETEILRDENAETRHRIDQTLDDLLKIHNAVCPKITIGSLGDIQGNASLFFRFALSCLVDADHYDTAKNYNDAIPFEGMPLNPTERLRLLDAYIENLSRDQQGNRTALRNSVYQACSSADTREGLYACDSPVGTGKTTAVMAHLLKAAKDKGLRRIFVVLPFTNIIDQSVDVYRRALVGLGEDESDIVAAHHHRAEFESLELRQYSFLWHAPIVVTTAVQFFETLASNQPMSLRKLHQLPGSAIFIDEAHATLPAHLWPQAWKWLKDLRDNWGCHFVLGSGSLNKFWRLEEFESPPIEIPELVVEDVRGDTLAYEDSRITYLSQPQPLTLDNLLDWLKEVPGPRLLIVNTVQSAAVIADKVREKRDRACVEHLSTSLCPRDRKKTLDSVRQRLDDRTDEDWTLVATSCVEAGVDLSFQTGLRERCSLNSLIQIGGRVNRKGEYQNAEVWDFQIRYDKLLISHRAFDTSARVLGELFSQKQVKPDSATEAMRREIRQNGLRKISDEIMASERNLRFPDVADKFKVIDSNTVTVIVDEILKDRLKKHEKVMPDDIQKGSVQIWADRKVRYDLQPLDGLAGMWAWNLLYDDFLGYMAGVLPLLKQDQNGSSFA
jgi:CRISPR-associated endonuclease/helicase Cas3